MKLKVGILGTRGIPNFYGGFEQFAQYLSLALAKKGHDVSVYNSSLHPYKEASWRGIRLIHCRDWENSLGTAGQFLYDLNCLNDARKRNFDILLQLGYTSNAVWHFRWPRGTVNIVNMDGLEWKRSKYNRLTRQFLKWSEKIAAYKADALVADSKGIQEYLLNVYSQSSTFIPYGAEIFHNPDPRILDQFDLKPYEYCLAIARMEPENNLELIIEGYLRAKCPQPLILVGNTKNKFGRYISSKYKGNGVRFVGAVFEPALINNLRHFSRLYFHGHSVGGTNPSLLEAMGCGCSIAAHSNPFNKGVLEEDAWYFSDPANVETIINAEIDENLVLERKKNNFEKILTLYNWNHVTDSYERIMKECIQKQ